MVQDDDCKCTNNVYCILDVCICIVKPCYKGMHLCHNGSVNLGG